MLVQYKFKGDVAKLEHNINNIYDSVERNDKAKIIFLCLQLMSYVHPSNCNGYPSPLLFTISTSD